MKYKQTLKVLLVDDNQVDRRILESMLADSSNAFSLFKSTNTLTDALKLLAENAFDVVLLDLNLPDSHGEDTLVRLNALYPSVAVVINTGAYEDEVGLRTLSIGAQDFLIKGKHDVYTLNKSLHYAVERKRIELELVRAYRKIKETQAHLISAEKMKVVGGLASGVAHEVKNPLATLLYGLTYLSHRFSRQDPQIDYVLENMQQAINRANGIITDLLNFASPAAMSQKSEDLELVVDKALDLVHHEFVRNHIILVKKIERSLPAIHIDGNRIEQVLINIILNAVHAMPQGGQILVRGYSRIFTGDMTDVPPVRKDLFKSGERIVVLSVEDDGCGIPPEMVDRIFDPFFTTRRGNGGVGLGLSVSKNIMDTHQGWIAVENKSDKGARATLVFKA